MQSVYGRRSRQWGSLQSKYVVSTVSIANDRCSALPAMTFCHFRHGEASPR